MTASHHRSLGLAGATSVGVGAIVGGGILALAGAAFAATGPAAILAFALNGIIAIVTALSFAEMSSRFPESGGTYTFAKKVLSLEAAFAVGWVVWFASIVAAALYAIGFAAFATVAVEHIWVAGAGEAPAWITTRRGTIIVAVAVTVTCTAALLRRPAGGGTWINVAKVIVFLLLVVAGLTAFAGSPAGTVERTMRPFLTAGAPGLLQAMGFTFIAWQGFDLIAAVAGEVRDPGRTLPRSMLLSLGVAMAIYMPLLFVVSTVGVGPDTTIAEMSAHEPETVIAVAARQFLGAAGYWIVIVAAILAMLSALQANLYAASRVALSMARDRTLPAVLERRHEASGSPRGAVLATAIIVAVIVLVLPDVAAAGAAASLIFLVTFALVQVIAVLARRRVVAVAGTFRTPLAPALPLAGALACGALCVYQGIAVPVAGLIMCGWLGLGGILFLALFAQRARVRDAVTQANDPELMRLRGRSPLVLVPIANPEHARAMVEIANALAPPATGRVLLLSVITEHDGGSEDERVGRTVADVQEALGSAMSASMSTGLCPEALATIAGDPWVEIDRVARSHGCESVLLGLSDLGTEMENRPLERLVTTLGSDAVVLRSTLGWTLEEARRVLVPIGGRGGNDVLRARLIGSLCRATGRRLHYLRVVPPSMPYDERRRARRRLEQLAEDESSGFAVVSLIESEHPADEIIRHAADSDLVIIGLQRHGRRHRLFGDLARRITRETSCAMILISRL